MLVRLLALAIAATIPVAAPAESPAQPTTTADPNEKICENIGAIGSRLAKKRVCATRAEWEERKRIDRQAIEQVQRQIGGPCQTTARNGGPTAC